ncbi:DUF317 domain-containing protein [Streptomyces sp. MNU76]|uniref:DUF317 domain-containing protein n=1 Tax=Streptomyces sp. MNU76 TaxID=2560026 RepID=UPI001E54BA38|nr:DUF317 domain-containing protein [Streptomyces sp. MNU76]MCC9707124.1 DUF317 domain-containing protein [Streptomyces sp. MNU76]
MLHPLNTPVPTHLDPPHPLDWPLYRVAPRYLAGPGDDSAGTVIQTLADAGWSDATWMDNTRVFDPSQRLALEFLPEAQPVPRLEGQRVLWRLWARRDALSPLSWTALFTDETPEEVLLPVVGALAANPDKALDQPLPYPTRTLTDNAPALAPLTAARWSPDPTEQPRTYHAPRLQARFTHQAPGRDGRPDHVPARWLATARLDCEAPAQWAASFDDTTPTHILAAFTTALADPTPVERYELPRGAEAYLTLTPA